MHLYLETIMTMTVCICKCKYMFLQYNGKLYMHILILHHPVMYLFIIRLAFYCNDLLFSESRIGDFDPVFNNAITDTEEYTRL